MSSVDILLNLYHELPVRQDLPEKRLDETSAKAIAEQVLLKMEEKGDKTEFHFTAKKQPWYDRVLGAIRNFLLGPPKSYSPQETFNKITAFYKELNPDKVQSPERHELENLRLILNAMASVTLKKIPPLVPSSADRPPLPPRRGVKLEEPPPPPVPPRTHRVRPLPIPPHEKGLSSLEQLKTAHEQILGLLGDGKAFKRPSPLKDFGDYQKFQEHLLADLAYAQGKSMAGGYFGPIFRTLHAIEKMESLPKYHLDLYVDALKSCSDSFVEAIEEYSKAKVATKRTDFKEFNTKCAASAKKLDDLLTSLDKPRFASQRRASEEKQKAILQRAKKATHETKAMDAAYLQKLGDHIEKRFKEKKSETTTDEPEWK